MLRNSWELEKQKESMVLHAERLALSETCCISSLSFQDSALGAVQGQGYGAAGREEMCPRGSSPQFATAPSQPRRSPAAQM